MIPLLAGSPFDSPYAIPIIAIVAGIGGWVLVTIAWTVSRAWSRVRTAAYNARLKQMMIEQGMSAEEIVRVIESGASESPDAKPGERDPGGRRHRSL